MVDNQEAAGIAKGTMHSGGPGKPVYAQQPNQSDGW